MSFTIKCDDGDLVTDTANKYVVIDKLEKCAQDLAESLLNSWDPEFEQYYNGSELYKIDENPTMFDDIGAEEFIRNAIEESVARLQDLQDADEFVDPEEAIDDIATLKVAKVPDSKSTWYFYLKVLTESEDFVEQDFDISLEQQLPASVRSGWPRSFLPATLDRGDTFK